MKIRELMNELQRALVKGVGDDTEVQVTGLYTTQGDLDSVDFTVRNRRTIEHVNGEPVRDEIVNESVVTLRTNCG